LDDACDALSEFCANVAQPTLAALVFHGVVKKRGDGFILVAAVNEHDGGDAEKVRDVWARRPLAKLRRVHARRVGQRAPESLPKRPLGRH
jgi:hypothetical protein